MAHEGKPDPYDGPLPEGEELEQIRATIQALRKAAAKSDWETNPEVRKATPLEIAVALRDRKDYHCIQTARRTWLPCTKRAIMGAKVCTKHGGSLKSVKKAAHERIVFSVGRVIDRLDYLAQQSDDMKVSHAACKTLLDRALPALRREQGPAKPVDTRPVIQVGVVLGGATQPVQITSGPKVKAALTAAKDGEVVPEE